MYAVQMVDPSPLSRRSSCTGTHASQAANSCLVEHSQPSVIKRRRQKPQSSPPEVSQEVEDVGGGLATRNEEEVEILDKDTDGDAIEESSWRSSWSHKKLDLPCK